MGFPLVLTAYVVHMLDMKVAEVAKAVEVSLVLEEEIQAMWTVLRSSIS